METKSCRKANKLVTVLMLLLVLFVLAKQSSAKPKYVLPPESFPGEARTLCIGWCFAGCAFKSKLHLVENVKCLLICLPRCRGRPVDDGGDGSGGHHLAAANNYCHIACSLDRCMSDDYPPTDAAQTGRCSAHCADNICGRDRGNN